MIYRSNKILRWVTELFRWCVAVYEVPVRAVLLSVRLLNVITVTAAT